MPISGSGDRQYFYPGVHNPVSSYPSVDIRGALTPTTNAAVGRVYVLSSSGDLRYVDPSGNDILVASQTSEEVFNNLYVSSSLLVKGNTVLSGNVVIGGNLVDLNSNLILSSSVGSVVAASGSLDFPNTDKTYHIRAVNSFLILSSSAGSYVYISGSLFASGSKHTITGSISISDNLSASALNFPVDAVSTLSHVRASNSHLILSSSAGSPLGLVVVSGSVLALSGVYWRGTTSTDVSAVVTGNNTLLFAGGSGGNTAIIRASRFEDPASATTMAVDEFGGRVTGKIYWSSATSAYNAGSREMTLRMGRFNAQGNATMTAATGTVCFSSSVAGISTTLDSGNGFLILSNSIGSVVALSASQDLMNSDKNYHIRAVNSNLILSSSAGSVVALSASADFMNADKNYHIRAFSSNLILSSSAGSIISLSGVLQITDAATNQSAHIVTPGTILILSGGAGSTNVVISGSLGFAGGRAQAVLQVRASAGNNAYMTVGTAGSEYFGVYETAPRIRASVDIGQNAAGIKIYNSVEHLVLSSSVGSVVKISGAMVVAQQTLASFPAGTDALTGAIMFDTTSKQFYGYGPAGWIQFCSGSNTL